MQISGNHMDVRQTRTRRTRSLAGLSNTVVVLRIPGARQSGEDLTEVNPEYTFADVRGQVEDTNHRFCHSTEEM